MQSSIPASGPKAAPALRRILLVDDDPMVTRSLERALGALRPDLEIRTAPSGERALTVLAEAPFDAVITDLNMPGLTGLVWLEKLRRENPTLLCVTHSSQLESFGEDEVRRLSHATFAKPAHAHALLEAIDRLLLLRSIAAHAGLRSA